MPYTLSKERDWPKVVALWDAGKIGFQVGSTNCMYRDPEHNNAPCIIGAAIPDEVVSEIDDQDDGLLAIDKIIKTKADEKDFWVEAQQHHDRAVNARRDYDLFQDKSTQAAKDAKKQADETKERLERFMAENR